MAITLTAAAPVTAGCGFGGEEAPATGVRQRPDTTTVASSPEPVPVTLLCPTASSPREAAVPATGARVAWSTSSSGAPSPRDCCRVCWRAAITDLPGGPWALHRLRRSALTHAAEHGTLVAYSGHTSLARYARVFPEGLVRRHPILALCGGRILAPGGLRGVLQ
ncbi:hypothetical protein [Nonomuraea jiangxiensis]|uniref:hypothetical protein n=1 Tax=Nonomuraea jiangxiensis TaxID=633440 RepID=UPI001C40B11A|nr:hypothetical protein [Nonomuraea jiangxiensis]